MGIEPSNLDYSNVTGIALCGGLGTRLGETTQGLLPKPLVPVNGSPLIDYSITPLYLAGMRRIVFATNRSYHGLIQHISEIVTSLPGLEPTFVLEDKPLDIIGAVKNALLVDNVTGEIAIFNTDTIRYGFDLKNIYGGHKSSEAATTMVSVESDEPSDADYGVVEDKDGVALLIHGGFVSGVLFTGLVFCSSEATRFLKETNTNGSWIDLLAELSLLGRSSIRNHLVDQPLIFGNVNTPEHLSRLSKYMAKAPAPSARESVLNLTE